MTMNKDTLNKLVIITLTGALLFWLVRDYNKKKALVHKEPFAVPASELLAVQTTKIEAADEKHNEKFKAVDYQTQQFPNDCFPRDKLTAADLLPKDAANSTWAQINVASQGGVSDQNFLNAGYHYGIDTQGSSLRNANLQIRSEPINSREIVSPWLNSTITPDLQRRPLEINGDC